MAVARATSYRLDPEIKQRLAGQAASERISERALLERLVCEGLDTLHYPGIVFREGATGRRAALAVGPDVWEVVSALRYTTGAQEERVAVLGEQFGLHPQHIRTAIDYAINYRQDIDDQVTANDAAAEQARLSAEGRARLMAS